MLFGSANHDERVFENPDVLDIDRQVHGRTTRSATASTTAWATRLPGSRPASRWKSSSSTLGEWEVDEANVVRNQLVPGRGIAHTPITFDPTGV